LLESFVKFFNQSKLKEKNTENEEQLMLIGGILLEAAAIDGKIDDDEIDKINKSLINFLGTNEEKSTEIINKCIEKLNEGNSLHYFTSKINKEFEYNKKIELLEILWEIVLADGKIHDFESNLIRRLSGLLYIPDIDSGNVKKKVLTKINRS